MSHPRILLHDRPRGQTVCRAGVPVTAEVAFSAYALYQETRMGLAVCVASAYNGLRYHHLAVDGPTFVPTTWSQDRGTWIERIERAAQLSEQNPWASEVLDFYGYILQFQKIIYERTRLHDAPTLTTKSGLREAVDLDAAERSFPDLVVLVRAHGPAGLAERASRLRDSPGSEIRGELERLMATTDHPQDDGSFFARILLQPQAEWLVRARGAQSHRVAGNLCPQCGSKPQLAVLRPEGDGGRRMLLCSLCQTEWDYRRILCPACGEVNHEKLPRYSAEGIPAVRVEACDTCKHYLKSVDMTVDGLAVPVVDEIATAPLDLWAVEHDYQKIQVNLMGF